MIVNMDFAQRVVVDTSSLAWHHTPASGVWRKLMEREAADTGHTTCLIKYEAGATYRRHYHPFGEEVLVLEGIFSDEFGNYPKGSYLRYPPGSGHSPFTEQGCTLLVKVNQCDEHDRQKINIDTSFQRWLPGLGGVEVMPLHTFRQEHVALIKWPAGTRCEVHRHFGGEELYIVKGCLADEYGHYPAGTWLRYPHMSQHKPYIGEETIAWVKTGHLPCGSEE